MCQWNIFFVTFVVGVCTDQTGRPLTFHLSFDAMKSTSLSVWSNIETHNIIQQKTKSVSSHQWHESRGKKSQ